MAEGSEHRVLLDAANGVVYKTTLLGTFGELYYLVNGIVNQRSGSLLEYLIRLRLWKKIFGASAPLSLGITEAGQIVSFQQYISGTPPDQEAVDDFLEKKAGLSDVKRKCWLWKKSYENYEIWVGDTRDENFVLTSAGIVPIDVRIWFEGAINIERTSSSGAKRFESIMD